MIPRLPEPWLRRRSVLTVRTGPLVNQWRISGSCHTNEPPNRRGVGAWPLAA